jgi:hypothetical protein
MGLGIPSLISTGPNHLDILFRGLGSDVWHLQWDGAGWFTEALGGDIVNFPSAAVTPRDGPTRRVYVYGRDNTLYENAKHGTASWSGWLQVSAPLGAPSLAGFPSAVLRPDDVVKVIGRAVNGNTLSFVRPSSWSYTNLGGGITGSPVAVPTGVFARGLDHGLYFHDGTTWNNHGGAID